MMRKATGTIEDLPVYFDKRLRLIADSRGIFWWKRIVVGPGFFMFPDRERLAILYHEAGHLKANAIERRLLNLWLIFVSPRSLMRLCREQEFEADAYAMSRGYRRELAAVLSRFPSSGGLLHPSSEARIKRMLSPPVSR